MRNTKRKDTEGYGMACAQDSIWGNLKVHDKDITKFFEFAFQSASWLAVCLRKTSQPLRLPFSHQSIEDDAIVPSRV